MKNLDSIIPISEEGLYPIRTVSEVTGVNSITLRAWERRYGLFEPKRTPKGHRLYSDKDIQRIHHVLELLNKGVSIGRVAKALNESKETINYSSFPTNESTTPKSKDLTEKQWQAYQKSLINKINTYDILSIEIFHHDIFSQHRIAVITEKLIRPVLEILSNRARQLQSLSGDYHFYKIFLTHRVGGLFLKTSIRNLGKKILLMGVDNEQCEIELLLFSMTLLSEGYQVVILGCGLSFDAIPMSLAASEADALLLFSGDEVSNNITTHEFQTLVSSLHAPVFVTGNYSELQEKALTESGLFILPAAGDKRIEMIENTLQEE